MVFFAVIETAEGVHTLDKFPKDKFPPPAACGPKPLTPEVSTE